MEKTMWVFIFQKYGKFWSVLLGHFIKHKLLISEEWIKDNIMVLWVCILKYKYLNYHIVSFCFCFMNWMKKKITYDLEIIAIAAVFLKFLFIIRKTFGIFVLWSPIVMQMREEVWERENRAYFFLLYMMAIKF